MGSILNVGVRNHSNIFFAQKMDIRAKYPVQLNQRRNNERIVYSYVHIILYRKTSYLKGVIFKNIVNVANSYLGASLKPLLI